MNEISVDIQEYSVKIEVGKRISIFKNKVRLKEIDRRITDTDELLDEAYTMVRYYATDDLTKAQHVLDKLDKLQGYDEEDWDDEEDYSGSDDDYDEDYDDDEDDDWDDDDDY